MRMRWLLAVGLAAGLAGVPRGFAEGLPAGLAEPDVKGDDAAYQAGSKALNESRWADAVTAFDQVIAAKGRKADAALYWKSYALGKLGKAALVDSTCQQLQKAYPDSTWNSDCASPQVGTVAAEVRRVQRDTQRNAAQAQRDQDQMQRDLQREVQRTQRDADKAGWPYHFDLDSHTHVNDPTGTGVARDPNEEMKMLALNSLLNRDPAQALPLLRGVLTGSGNPDLKQHALFVLGQSRAPESLALMHDLIVGKMGPELQRESIQAAGIYEGRRLNDALVEAYHGTADTKIKQAVISAFFISGDDARMVEVARGEKNLEMKRTIVAQLSLMQGKAANDYMLELLK